MNRALGTAGTDTRVDSQTPRLHFLRKNSDQPLLSPGQYPWMNRAVFDARPIHFAGRRLIYFCGQFAYRADSQLFIGLMEANGDTWSIRPQPVLAADVEKYGIDIPAFTVWNGRLVGIYFDSKRSKAIRSKEDAGIVLVLSDDGVRFKKVRMDSPFGGARWDRVGLPWLLADGNRLLVYFRAKRGERNFIVRGVVNLETTAIDLDGTSVETPRPPVNVAVTKRLGTYILHYAYTLGGGIYAVPSHDGIHWQFDREVMLVDPDIHDWGWDSFKICPSPDNDTGPIGEICYLGTSVGFGVGHGFVDYRSLVAHWAAPA